MATITLDVETHPADDMADSVVYVSDETAEAESPELAALAAEEAALGDLRNCPSVREGGSHPEVDDLYRRLNEKIAEVKTGIARRVLTRLGARPAQLAEKAYFSRNAGYGEGVRDPGVVVPGLRLGGRRTEIVVRLAK